MSTTHLLHSPRAVRSARALGTVVVTVTALTTFAACAQSDHVTGLPDADALRPTRVSYELTLAAGDAADGAVMLGIRGMTVDSVTALPVTLLDVVPAATPATVVDDAPSLADVALPLVTSLAGEIDGETRLVVAGAIANGATVRVWGTGPAGVPPVVAVREAVASATLAEASLPARTTLGVRRAAAAK